MFVFHVLAECILIDNNTTTYNKCRPREIYCLRRHFLACKNVQTSYKSGLYGAEFSFVTIRFHFKP